MGPCSGCLELSAGYLASLMVLPAKNLFNSSTSVTPLCTPRFALLGLVSLLGIFLQGPLGRDGVIHAEESSRDKRLNGYEMIKVQ